MTAEHTEPYLITVQYNGPTRLRSGHGVVEHGDIIDVWNHEADDHPDLYVAVDPVQVSADLGDNDNGPPPADDEE